MMSKLKKNLKNDRILPENVIEYVEHALKPDALDELNTLVSMLDELSVNDLELILLVIGDALCHKIKIPIIVRNWVKNNTEQKDITYFFNKTFQKLENLHEYLDGNIEFDQIDEDESGLTVIYMQGSNIKEIDNYKRLTELVDGLKSSQLAIEWFFDLKNGDFSQLYNSQKYTELLKSLITKLKTRNETSVFLN